MSFESFHVIASAYDGDPDTQSHITFADDIARERVYIGIADQELVGVWRVQEQSGETAYHVVRSDVRAGSGVGIDRSAAVQADGPDGINIDGAFEGEAVNISPDGTATLGGVCLQSLIEISGVATAVRILVLAS